MIRDEKDCIKLVTCENSKEDCYYGKCPNCPGVEKLQNIFRTTLNKNKVTEISFKQWIHNPRTELKKCSMTTENFIKHLGEETKKLLPHALVSQQQAQFTRELQDKLKEGEFITQVDFAGNYPFIVQNAAPGFHWNNDSATVYNIVIYFKKNNKIEHRSLVIISDCLKHDAVSVYAFNKIIVKYLKENFPIVSKIYYISDGAPQQYKNYKNIINLCKHKEDFNVEAEWHFFATAHGKGPCDGLGASVKRSAARHSLQSDHNDPILNATDLFNFLNTTSRIQKIDFVFFKESEYESIKNSLESRFATKKRVKNIQDKHSFIPLDANTVQVKNFSKSESSAIFKIL